MKISDLLRQLADKMELDNSKTPLSIASTDSADTNSVAQGEDNPEFNTMVSPLQQKMELIKKHSGIDNIYDNTDEKSDELDQLKKNAGLPQKPNQLAGDENDSF
jgi:hypothetical protein